MSSFFDGNHFHYSCAARCDRYGKANSVSILLSKRIVIAVTNQDTHEYLLHMIKWLVMTSSNRMVMNTKTGGGFITAVQVHSISYDLTDKNYHVH